MLYIHRRVSESIQHKLRTHDFAKCQLIIFLEYTSSTEDLIRSAFLFGMNVRDVPCAISD